MTRVVLVIAGGQHVSAYFSDRKKAKEFIAEWLTWTKQNADQTAMYTLQNESGECAAIARAVLAMYIPVDKPTAADRVADVLEKQNFTTEDWR